MEEADFVEHFAEAFVCELIERVKHGAQGPAQKHWVLRDDGETRAEVPQPAALPRAARVVQRKAEVGAVEEDAAGAQGREAEEGREKRRLTAARAPGDADTLSGQGLESEVSEHHRRARSVPHADSLEHEVSSARPLALPSARRLAADVKALVRVVKSQPCVARRAPQAPTAAPFPWLSPCGLFRGLFGQARWESEAFFGREVRVRFEPLEGDQSYLGVGERGEHSVEVGRHFKGVREAQAHEGRVGTALPEALLRRSSEADGQKNERAHGLETQT
mmetsp:Transcript_59113/g.133842  ORF Transcript_59113/g.133842 Transcript_59113/m.133842 type:complete len:276 (+) Transcript_59113:694-1521(+)